MARRRRSSLTPALIASFALHGGVAALAFLSLNLWPDEKRTLGPVVPVTIVDGPPADLRPALAADETLNAQAPDPDPLAPPTPPAPEVAPRPEPPTQATAPTTPTKNTTAPPKPAPAPTPKPAPRKPTPRKPAPAKPADKPFDLDALAASVAGASRRAPRAGGAEGPARAETAPAARQGAGLGERLSASEVDALRSKLERLWNPNCAVEGGADVAVRVRIRLNPDGTLARNPEVLSKSGADRAVVEAAATRAVNAVGRGSPYNELNPENYAAWDIVTFNFNAKQACARR